MEKLPVNISQRACEELRNILESKKVPAEYSVRVGIKGGGCGAAGFVIGFDKASEHDMNFLHEGVPFIIDKRHIMYVFQLEIEFEEHEDERGFSFTKPS